jgi:hypothetical protein
MINDFMTSFDILDLHIIPCGCIVPCRTCDGVFGLDVLFEVVFFGKGIEIGIDFLAAGIDS